MTEPLCGCLYSVYMLLPQSWQAGPCPERLAVPQGDPTKLSGSQSYIWKTSCDCTRVTGVIKLGVGSSSCSSAGWCWWLSRIPTGRWGWAKQGLPHPKWPVRVALPSLRGWFFICGSSWHCPGHQIMEPPFKGCFCPPLNVTAPLSVGSLVLTLLATQWWPFINK